MKFKNKKIKLLEFRVSSLEFPREAGLGMVEMIVVLGILVTTFATVLQTVFLQRRAQVLAEQHAAAHIVAREAMEAVRSVRDSDWSNVSSLSYSTPYYPQVNASGEWELSSTNPGPVSDIYSRWVEFDEVFRDANDDIAASGTSDPDTKKVITYVEWTMPGGDIRTITLETYITNWQSYQ